MADESWKTVIKELQGLAEALETGDPVPAGEVWITTRVPEAPGLVIVDFVAEVAGG